MKLTILILMILFAATCKSQNRKSIKIIHDTSTFQICSNMMITRQPDTAFGYILKNYREPKGCSNNYAFYIDGHHEIPSAYIQNGKLVINDSLAAIKSLIIVLIEQYDHSFKAGK